MSEFTLDPSLFTANSFALTDPTVAELRECFALLPKRACLEVLCAWDRRLEMRAALEACAGFAIRLEVRPGFDRVRITAFKGKAGPCYETGRTAAYRGVAAAVLDDDHHLIVGSLRVCEKTGGLYTLPPYRALLQVSPADAALLARLDTDPLPFDCDTLERDARRLAELGSADSATAGEAEAVLYPGPFRLLVLRNGMILRRGVCARIPAAAVPELVVRDGLLVLPPTMQGDTAVPELFAAAFAERGPRCLLAPAPGGEGAQTTERTEGTERTEQTERRKGTTGTTGTDAAAAAAGDVANGLPESAATHVQHCSAELRQRLQRLVAQREPYFILTGSDPGDPLGCCPSELVGEANRLVAAGVLARHRDAPAPGACTTTTYAFTGEIGGPPDAPCFTTNEAVREQVAGWLGLTHSGFGCAARRASRVSP